MESKKRRVRRTPEEYRKEVEDKTNGEYSVLGEYVNAKTKVLHVHNVCGHEWETTPSSFISKGTRCPKCYARSRVSRTPESYKREVSEITNGEYSVLGEFVNVGTKIVHRHAICGHEWGVTPNSFVSKGSRCPECYDKNRNRKTAEQYVLEVRALVGDEYSVLETYKNNATKIAHIHNKCGHIWKMVPRSFISQGSRCPNCANKRRNLKTNAQFVAEVYDLVGDEYTFLEAYSHSMSKLKIKHNICGRVYGVVPGSFFNGNRCPHCAKVFRMSDTDFRKRVYDLVGMDYMFLEPYVNSSTHLKVKHVACGNVYRVAPHSFFAGTRCPNCIFSRGEKAVADVLDSLSIEYSREHTFEYLGRKRYDFFIPSLNIAIEYDGEQHFKAVDAWGGEDKLKQTQESDALKNDFCDYMGIDLLRIPYWEFDNIDEIVTNFIDTVKLMRSISDSSIEMAKCR